MQGLTRLFVRGPEPVAHRCRNDGNRALLDGLPLSDGEDTFAADWINAVGAARTGLRRAIECFDDGIGNDDGFCASDETCLYPPNIGSYQGHGDGISVGGALTGINPAQVRAEWTLAGGLTRSVYRLTIDRLIHGSRFA